MNRLEQLYRTSSQPAAFAKGYLDYLREVLSSLDVEAIGSFIGVLLEARERGARIFFCGNGGSAATASHFANDLAMGCRSWEKPFRAVSLTDNVPILTAVSNDYGYDEVFVRQLQTQMERGRRSRRHFRLRQLSQRAEGDRIRQSQWRLYRRIDRF